MRLNGLVYLGAYFEQGGDFSLMAGADPVSRCLGPVLQVNRVGAVFSIRCRVGPRFVAREGQDGGKQADQRMENLVESRLRGAAERSVRAERVEAVFEDVVVNRRERDGAELVAELVNAVEFVGVVGLRALVDEGGGLVQCPAVEGVELFDGHGIEGDVEIEKI